MREKMMRCQVCPDTKERFGELCRNGAVSILYAPDYDVDEGQECCKAIPEYRGISIEGDYALILDNNDGQWWTLSVYTRDLTELAYRVRHLSATACIYEAAEEYLKVRRKYGVLQYNYDGVWVDCVA